MSTAVRIRKTRSSRVPNWSSGTMFGTIAGRRVRIGMRLEEQPVDADRHGRAGQRLNHPPIAARGTPQSSRFLDAVRRVEQNRGSQLRHLNERPHIVDQASVAEKSPPLAEQHVAASGRDEFIDDMPHVAGREELSLLDVDRSARPRRSRQQIRLPSEEGRNLQQLADFAGRSGLPRLVNVGRHRHSDGVAHTSQNLQSPFQARTSKRIDTRAVGFVERCLEDPLHRQTAR